MRYERDAEYIGFLGAGSPAGQNQPSHGWGNLDLATMSALGHKRTFLAILAERPLSGVERTFPSRLFDGNSSLNLECLLFSKADVQIMEIWGNRRAAFGQERT